jgi:hypothetical protein
MTADRIDDISGIADPMERFVRATALLHEHDRAMRRLAAIRSLAGLELMNSGVAGKALARQAGIHRRKLQRMQRVSKRSRPE